MSLYARIENGLAAEIVTLPAGVTPDKAFHPSLVFHAADANVRAGWVFADGVFSPPAPPQPSPPTEAEARAECARRIFAAASANTQNNLNAYINVLNAKGALTNPEKADVAAFGEAFLWIAAMRSTWKQLLAAGDADFRNDAKWPPLPAAAAALAARF